MLPFIHIGAARIPTYPLVYALAFFIFTSLSLAQVRGSDRYASRVRLGLLACAAAFMVGVYLPALVQLIIERLGPGQPSGPFEPRVYYGLAAAVLAGIWVNHGYPRVELIRNLDRFIIYMPLAYAVARLGCLAAGCCGGAETDSILGMHAPDDHDQWANRYPTQLLSGGAQLALFVFFFWLSRWREKPPTQGGWKAWLNRPGALFWLYLLAFAVERFLMDFLRYDYRPIWGPLSLPQLLMLAVMAGAAVWLARSRWSAPNL